MKDIPERLTYSDGFKAGREYAMRDNKSGCCCKIADDEETILSPCAAHAAWAHEIEQAAEQRGAERMREEADAKLCQLRDISHSAANKQQTRFATEALEERGNTFDRAASVVRALAHHHHGEVT